MREVKIILALAGLLPHVLISSCTAVKAIRAPGNTTIGSLKFLGQYILPDTMQFKATTVGGLSGIDYDAQNDLYYLISDDRSSINPARFYTAKINISSKGIKDVQLTGVSPLLQKDGTIYPGSKKDPWRTPDPEAIRYNPITQQLVWSSEGERIIKNGDTVLENPSISLVTKSGVWLDTFPLPEILQMQADEKGPRRNGVLEGLAFSDNYNTLYASLEVPLYEDGPTATVADNSALIRIFKFDVKSKKNIAQYAYKLAPVAYPPVPEKGFEINGISDILCVSKNQLLVTERSSSEGVNGFFIKVYLADMSRATNIKDITSLSQNPPLNSIEKKLLLNMESLSIAIDNIEGATFGPILQNGHCSLVFVADNNFNKAEQTQFLLFEVLP